MKKTLIILSLLISTLAFTQPGEKNFIDQNYIQVTGTAEMEVIPDQIFLSIFLNESDLKGKMTLEELEASMIVELEKLGIDIKKDLAIIDLESNFKDYFIKESRTYQSKVYELMVKDAGTAGKVMLTLEDLNISQIYILRVDNSNLEELKRQVKINAIIIAKVKAEELSEAIGQSIGKALYIEEISDLQVINKLSGKVAGVTSNIVVRGSTGPQSEFNQPEIEFEKIKLQYSIFAKFELK